jgi:hypothetical protein
MALEEASLLLNALANKSTAGKSKRKKYKELIFLASTSSILSPVFIIET